MAVFSFPFFLSDCIIDYHYVFYVKLFYAWIVIKFIVLSVLDIKSRYQSCYSFLISFPKYELPKLDNLRSQ